MNIIRKTREHLPYFVEELQQGRLRVSGCIISVLTTVVIAMMFLNDLAKSRVGGSFFDIFLPIRDEKLAYVAVLLLAMYLKLFILTGSVFFRLKKSIVSSDEVLSASLIRRIVLEKTLYILYSCKVYLILIALYYVLSILKLNVTLYGAAGLFLVTLTWMLFAIGSFGVLIALFPGRFFPILTFIALLIGIEFAPALIYYAASDNRPDFFYSDLAGGLVYSTNYLVQFAVVMFLGLRKSHDIYGEFNTTLIKISVVSSFTAASGLYVSLLYGFGPLMRRAKSLASRRDIFAAES